MLTLLRLPIVLALVPLILIWCLGSDSNPPNFSSELEPSDKLVLRLDRTKPPLPLLEHRPHRIASIRAARPSEASPDSESPAENDLVRGRIYGWSPLSNEVIGKSPPTTKSARRLHRVVDGDDLPDLAARYLGDRERYLEIYEANRSVLPSPDLLPLGTVIRIPDSP